MKKRLKELLVKICTMSMDEQLNELEKALREWQGSETQVDDVCVIGIRF